MGKTTFATKSQLSGFPYKSLENLTFSNCHLNFPLLIKGLKFSVMNMEKFELHDAQGMGFMTVWKLEIYQDLYGKPLNHVRVLLMISFVTVFLNLIDRMLHRC